MKNLLLIFFLPLLVTIVGSNSKLQYGDCNLLDKNITKTETKNEASKSFSLTREINFLPDSFVCSKQKWYVRFLGVFLIFFPFIPSFFPFKNYFENKMYELAFNLRHLGTDVMDQMIRNKSFESLEELLELVYVAYLIFINGLVVVFALYLDFSPCMYSLFLYEKSLNFIAWLI